MSTATEREGGREENDSERGKLLCPLQLGHRQAQDPHTFTTRKLPQQYFVPSFCGLLYTDRTEPTSVALPSSPPGDFQSRPVIASRLVPLERSPSPQVLSESPLINTNSGCDPEKFVMSTPLCPCSHFESPKGFRSSEPGTGMKTKHIFLTTNHSITTGCVCQEGAESGPWERTELSAAHWDGVKPRAEQTCLCPPAFTDQGPQQTPKQTIPGSWRREAERLGKDGPGAVSRAVSQAVSAAGPGGGGNLQAQSEQGTKHTGTQGEHAGGTGDLHGFGNHPRTLPNLYPQPDAP